MAGTRKINQNAPHQPRTQRKKVGPVLPVDVSYVDQPQVGFVDEGHRGLQTVVGTLSPHLAASQPSQLLAHQGNQFLQRAFVAIVPRQ